jgi:hypothetical protein
MVGDAFRVASNQGRQTMHYIKFSKGVINEARRQQRENGNGQTSVFDDLTRRGTELVYEPLTPNAQGPRIAIHGARASAEAGIDRDRDDTIFVYRLVPVYGTQSRLIPVRAHFLLLPAANPPRVEAVRYLFERVPAQQQNAPSPRLARMLKDAPSETRTSCRPAVKPVAKPAGIEELRVLWRRYGLEQLAVGLPPRPVAILAGVIEPSDHDHGDAEALSRLFDVGLLNRVAVAWQDRPGELYRFLEDFCQAPTDDKTRAVIWCGMLRGLSPSALKIELQESVEALLASAQASDGSGPYEDELLPVLHAAAGKPAGLPLRELLYRADGIERSFEDLVDVLRDRATSTNERSAPSSVTASPVVAKPQATSPTAAFDEWVFFLRGTSTRTIATTTDQVLSYLIALSDVVRGPITVRSAQALATALTTLKSELEIWLRAIPTAEQLELSEREALDAIREAEPVLAAELDRAIALQPTPSVLSQVAHLLRNETVLSKAPSWLWNLSSDEPRGEAPLWKLLMNPVLAQRAQLLLQLFAELSSLISLDDVTVLPPPSGTTAMDEFLELSLRDLAATRQQLNSIPENHRGWVRHMLGAGLAIDDVLRLSKLVQQTEQRFRADVADAIM